MGLLLGLVAVGANAQFNRVGNQASLQMVYTNLNPKDSSSWEGVQITNLIPLGVQTAVFDQPLRFNLDLNAGYTFNNNVNIPPRPQFFSPLSPAEAATLAKWDAKYGHGLSNSGTFGSYGFGVTTWINQDFDKAEWAIAPYVRVGVAANSGTLGALDNQYWSYQLEPGIVARYGNFYGMTAFNYSDGFKSDGFMQQAWALGAGVNLTKSFAIETRYDIGYGNYDVNRWNLGVTYKF